MQYAVGDKVKLKLYETIKKDLVLLGFEGKSRINSLYIAIADKVCQVINVTEKGVYIDAAENELLPDWILEKVEA